MSVTEAGARRSRVLSPLDQVRQASGYRRARLVVKTGFRIGTLTTLGVLAYSIATRRGPSPLLSALASVFLITCSFALVEIATAIFDIADMQLQFRARQDSNTLPRS